MGPSAHRPPQQCLKQSPVEKGDNKHQLHTLGFNASRVLGPSMYDAPDYNSHLPATHPLPFPDVVEVVMFEVAEQIAAHHRKRRSKYIQKIKIK
jgi:hypothetical protein